jgi:hypothetical protein
MARFWSKCVVFSILFPVLAPAQDKPIQSERLAAQPASPFNTDKLPIKRVVLYKNGVGYFEHLGSVQDNQASAISFTSGQLNDVLKSLTVLDLNGGRVTGVAYGSANPIDKQLGDLRLPLNEKPSLSEFLGALRGTRMEVRSGTNAITGRLLSIERKTRISGGTTLEIDYLSLITDSGDVRTTELSPAFSVRLLEKGLPAKVDRYLDLVSSSRDADVRRMVISTEGSGERSLFVSYISEVPVWKATYRIVLNSKTRKMPLLQGWAVVDNTVGQDWDNVQLSLVAGAPQSFVQNLSQPYYSRRPVVPLPQSVAISPQTFESTLVRGPVSLSGVVTDASGAVIAGAIAKAYGPGGEMAEETTTDSQGRYEFRARLDGDIRLEIEKPGFITGVLKGITASPDRPARGDAVLQVGASSQTVTVNAQASSLETSTSSVGSRGRTLGNGSGLDGRSTTELPLNGRSFTALISPAALAIDRARSRAEVATAPQGIGDLFEYRLKEPVTIPKNRSALVPIVQSVIEAEKVSVWNERAGFPRPQRALWLTNTSGLTLDGGSFSVLEEETFAGEGIFDPIRPGEKRLVSYATDLALGVGSRTASAPQRVTRVRISHGIITQVSEVRESKTYTFRNEESTPRIVIVEHPVRPDYELRGEARPEETTAGWMRFRVQVEPKQTATLAIEESRPVETTVALTDIADHQVDLFVRERSVNKTVEEALRRILTQKKTVDDLDEQKSAREEEAMKIFDDQQRLRENMKALKGSADEKALLQRYTRQLGDEEDRLEALRKGGQQLEAQHEAARAELDRLIENLSLDEKL